MTKKEKWIVDKDDGLRLFYGDENFNGSAYPCNDIVFMKMIADKLNKLEKENEQLKSILKIYHKVANCRNCHYHDYDTLFGGYDDYEICNKGNDVSDGICSEWREH